MTRPRLAQPKAWAVGLVVLACFAPVGRAAGCMVSLQGSKGLVACEGDVPATTEDGQEWSAALARLQNATSLDLAFQDVQFDADSFNRALGLLWGTAGAGSVAVTLSGCGMEGQEVIVASLAQIAGSRQVAVTVTNSEFLNNRLNVTGAVAVQYTADVSLKLLGSAVEGNSLLVLGAAAVGASGKAAIQVAESSVVDGNQVAVFGVLGVSGDGGLSIQLSSANITRNSLSGGSALALGGAGSKVVTGADSSSVVVEGNRGTIRTISVAEQPLVSNLLDIVLGIGFNESGLDVATELRDLQGEACAVLDAAANATASAAELPKELSALVEQIGSRLCSGAEPSSSFDLASLAPAAQAWASGGLDGLAAVGDQLLGTGGVLADTARALTNGSITAPEQLGPVVDRLLGGLLTGPQGDAAAGWLVGALGAVKQWLDTPLGGAKGATGLSSNATEPKEGSSGMGADLGEVVGSIVDSILGGQDGQGTSSGSKAGSSGAAGLGSILDSLVASLTGGNGSSTTPGDLLNQLVGVVGGAQGKEGLQGVDVTALLSVLGAVVKDPKSRSELPGLVSAIVSGGDISKINLSAIIGAVLGDKEASAQLPALLALAQQLGLPLKL